MSQKTSWNYFEIIRGTAWKGALPPVVAWTGRRFDREAILQPVTDHFAFSLMPFECCLFQQGLISSFVQDL
jgi:hypothetical protein